jgi:hypothetical protein
MSERDVELENLRMTIEFVRRWAIDKEGNGTSAAERLSAIANHPGIIRPSTAPIPHNHRRVTR